MMLQNFLKPPTGITGKLELCDNVSLGFFGMVMGEDKHWQFQEHLSWLGPFPCLVDLADLVVVFVWARILTRVCSAGLKGLLNLLLQLVEDFVDFAEILRVRSKAWKMLWHRGLIQLACGVRSSASSGFQPQLHQRHRKARGLDRLTCYWDPSDLHNKVGVQAPVSLASQPGSRSSLRTEVKTYYWNPSDSR